MIVKSFVRSLLRKATVALAGVMVAGALAAPASAYCDFSGYMDRWDYYYECSAIPSCTNDNVWWIRLSRQSCGTKMQLFRYDQTWYTVPFPGGCDTNDYKVSFQDWAGARCYNMDGPRMWVNCRIDPNSA